MRRLTCAAMLLVAVCLAGCKRKTEAPPERPPRPVKAVRLKQIDPTQHLRLTGSVASWKQQDVGFEVSGRVEWVIEEGSDVIGRALDEEGKLISEGTVIARLDKTRYELQVSSMQAQVKRAQAELAAARIELEQVLPEQLNAAKAEKKRSESEFRRARQLTEARASSQAELETAEAAFQTATARVAQVEASIVAKRAELKAIEAAVLQANEALKQAKADLDDCELRAPFSARVAKVHVVPGAYAAPGRQVVTLIVMDPIEIELSVSAGTDRAVSYGDLVTAYPPDSDEPVIGWVERKDTVADPNTRTFRLSVMVRNRRIPVDLPGDPELSKLPRVDDVTTPVKEDPGGKGPLFVDLSALRKDAQGFYVWQVRNFQLARAHEPFDPVLVVKKTRVVPGAVRVAILDYLFRELKDAGGLNEYSALLSNPPEGLKDGDKVLLVRERWMFRPGDIVRVLLELPSSGPGFYVPMAAIRPEGDAHYVFVAKGEGLGRSRAEGVEIRLTGSMGEMRRIEGEGIQEGTLVIREGAHYLIPNEEISVTQIQDASPVEAGAEAAESKQ